MMKIELPRTSSYNSTTTTNIIPTTYIRSTSYKPHPNHHHTTNTNTSVVLHRHSKPRLVISAFFRSLINLISFPMILPTCRWLTIPSHLSITPALGRKVTGTLFGNRRGHVSFAVQYDPRSAPVLIIELAVSTSTLVKEMSSGLVRIALECSKGPTTHRHGKLWKEPMWTMYCNGRKSGYALSRECTQSDWHVLSTVESVSAGAGVIPVVEDGRKGGLSEGELLYMRSRFERVVGTQHSEAYYMINPDGNDKNMVDEQSDETEFTAIIRVSHIDQKGHGVYIPNRLFTIYRTWRNSQVVKLNYLGVEWNVQVHRKKKMCRFGLGWDDFTFNKNFAVGKKLRFVYRDNHTFNVFYVV